MQTKKYFDQLLVAQSTQKLVEINNKQQISGSNSKLVKATIWIPVMKLVQMLTVFNQLFNLPPNIQQKTTKRYNGMLHHSLATLKGE